MIAIDELRGPCNEDRVLLLLLLLLQLLLFLLLLELPPELKKMRDVTLDDLFAVSDGRGRGPTGA